MRLVASVRPFVCLFVCKEELLPFQEVVCVSVIIGRLLTIARMRSIGF